MLREREAVRVVCTCVCVYLGTMKLTRASCRATVFPQLALQGDEPILTFDPINGSQWESFPNVAGGSLGRKAKAFFYPTSADLRHFALWCLRPSALPRNDHYLLPVTAKPLLRTMWQMFSCFCELARQEKHIRTFLWYLCNCIPSSQSRVILKAYENQTLWRPKNPTGL